MPKASRQESTQPPATKLDLALQAAEKGRMPSFTSDSLLRSLHLDQEAPDGLTLMQRLVGDEPDFAAFRSVLSFMSQTHQLIRSTNEYTANPAQETIAQALGTVVTRQLCREEDICPTAREMALASTREDIIPGDVKAILYSEEGQTKGPQPEEIGGVLALEIIRIMGPPPASPGFCGGLCRRYY